jgi:hypothetical protein
MIPLLHAVTGANAFCAPCTWSALTGWSSQTWPEKPMFNADRLYRADELGEIANTSTLAKWRMRGIGPPFLELEGQVLFEGAALNAYLASKRVRPTDEPPASADDDTA